MREDGVPKGGPGQTFGIEFEIPEYGPRGDLHFSLREGVSWTIMY